MIPWIASDRRHSSLSRPAAVVNQCDIYSCGQGIIMLFAKTSCRDGERRIFFLPDHTPHHPSCSSHVIPLCHPLTHSPTHSSIRPSYDQGFLTLQQGAHARLAGLRGPGENLGGRIFVWQRSRTACRADGHMGVGAGNGKV